MDHVDSLRSRSVKSRNNDADEVIAPRHAMLPSRLRASDAQDATNLRTNPYAYPNQTGFWRNKNDQETAEEKTMM